MTRISIPALVALAGFMAAAVFILVRRFYGALSTIGLSASMPLWIVAAVCLFVAYMVKKRREEGNVGLDLSLIHI